MSNSRWNRSRIRKYNMFDHVVSSDDKLKEKDAGGLHGQVIFGTGRHIVHYIDPYGRPAYRTEFEHVDYIDDNIVPIGAYQFVFDKLFNIGLDQESTLRVGDLNDELPMMKIGVPREEYQSIKYNMECTSDGSLKPRGGVNISANNYIIGFMMGNGGAREDGDTAIAPNYKNRSLYNAIPFRRSDDGIAIPDGKYYGRSTTIDTPSVTSSYVKLFDDPAPHIVHVWATGNPNEFSIVDDTVFASTSSIPIESYVEMNLSIDINDGRGWAAQSNITPKINEIGLVTGWYNELKDDFESLRLFTHFTRPSITLTDGDAVQAIYRLYGR